jgi:hypothetical protein
MGRENTSSWGGRIQAHGEGEYKLMGRENTSSWGGRIQAHGEGEYKLMGSENTSSWRVKYLIKLYMISALQKANSFI